MTRIDAQTSLYADVRGDEPLYLASIDIGSNTALLLVVALRGEGVLDVVAEAAEITRISEGLDRAGELAEEPVARTEAALREFGERCRELGVSKIWATGTAPFRRARNGAEVARRLADALGAPIDVISGGREAALGRVATRAAFPDVRTFALLDIGGASTELVGEPEGCFEPVSMDIGSVRLTERYAPFGVLDVDSLCAMRQDIAAALEEAFGKAGERGEGPTLPPEAIAIAGTATTLAALDLGLRSWDADAVHGHVLPGTRLAELVDVLAPMPPAERTRCLGVDPRRADVIGSGALLLHELMIRFGWNQVRISDRGLRWGRLHSELDKRKR